MTRLRLTASPWQAEAFDFGLGCFSTRNPQPATETLTNRQCRYYP